MSPDEKLVKDPMQSAAEELLSRFYAGTEPGGPGTIEELCDAHPDLASKLVLLHRDCQQIESILSGFGGPELERGFEVGEELGRGSYGQVFRATDRALQREVALKIVGEGTLLPAAARGRFLHEARTLASLEHPNIVRIHSIDEHDGRPCLSMELIDGLTLKQLFDLSGPFSAIEAVRIGIDLARALAAIHARHIVHMDVKPANVMREEGGRIVLLDFGFARSRAALGDDAEGPVGGTPLFMSPEQLRCDTELGPASDIYSLGVLLFWMVSGRYPHQASTVPALRMSVLQGEPLRLADTGVEVPAELTSIIERATAREAADRYASAGELERALRQFLGSQGEVLPPPVRPGRAGWLRSRRGLLTVGAATVALALGGWQLFSGPRPLDVEYALYARREQAVRLAEDDPVSDGDMLFLTLSTNQPAWVYVFNADEAGHFYGLFPLEQGAQNPLQPGRVHELPEVGGGWGVSEAGGGAEYLYVMASLAPIPEVQRLHDECTKAGQAGLPADQTALIVAPLTRGIGTVHRPEAPEDPVRRVRALFDELSQQSAPDSHVFRVRLAHPDG